MTKDKLKQLLIKVRNGAFITPILEEIHKIYKKELEKVYRKGYRIGQYGGYKEGYNERLKDEGKVGEKHQHLYL